MYEGMTYQKEKRKKRLTQNNRKKLVTDRKYEKGKKHIKPLSNNDQYLDRGELINSR